MDSSRSRIGYGELGIISSGTVHGVSVLFLVFDIADGASCFGFCNGRGSGN